MMVGVCLTNGNQITVELIDQRSIGEVGMD
jgi:hypothetical protein